MNQRATRNRQQFRASLALARRLWAGQIRRQQIRTLDALFQEFRMSVVAGDLQLLDGRWYVTHAGLLRLACRKKCSGIKTAIQKALSDPIGNRWVFKAIVYTTPGSKGFVGYGDADPSNISPLVRGSEMRVAETRAVNRALRKAYGIGLCSAEELRYLTSSSEPTKGGSASIHSNGNGQFRLRDRLCLLIRQHQLDPTLVKRYAADFCGTQELKDASRDLVESFIAHLAAWSVKDRAGLLSKLNSFAQSQEVQS